MNTTLTAASRPLLGKWVAPYLGKPWRSAAHGPNYFDCWGLVWHVYFFTLNIKLPVYPGINEIGQCEVNALIIDAEAKSGTPESPWQRVEVPAEFDVAVMGSVRTTHLGLYSEADGGIIVHCADGRNVVAETPYRLKASGVNKISYYRHNGAHH